VILRHVPKPQLQRVRQIIGGCEMNAFFSQLLAHEQAHYQGFADQVEAQWPLEQLLARAWDVEAFRRACGWREDTARLIANWQSLLPDWTPEQIRTALSIECVGQYSWLNPIARRIVRDDPAELGVGLCVVNRVQWLHRRLMEQTGLGPEENEVTFLPLALAVRDIELARQFVTAPVVQEQGEVDKLISQAVSAAWSHNPDGARAAAERLNKRKMDHSQKWMCKCLLGVARDDADLVTEGLQQAIDEENRERWKERGETINLWAHGYFRLCERVSPALVAKFNISQSPAWDAGFHAWTSIHDNALEGIDLTGISPLLHNAVVRLQLPPWWRVPDEPESPNDICEVTLTAIGPNPAKVSETLQVFCRQWKEEMIDLAARVPIVAISGIPRFAGVKLRKLLYEAGAAATVAKVVDGKK
jgi:hypothetical protein